MSSIFFDNYVTTTAASLDGLPDYMADGALVKGTVVSNSKLHPSVPGIPTNLVASVDPEFLQALNDIKQGRAAFGKNNKFAIAEDTVITSVTSDVFVAAYDSSKAKILAMMNEKILNGSIKAKCRHRVLYLLVMAYAMDDTEFNTAYTSWKAMTPGTGNDDQMKELVATMYDNLYYGKSTYSGLTTAANNAVGTLNKVKAKDTKYTAATFEGKFQFFPVSGSSMKTGPIVAKRAAVASNDFNGMYRVVEESELTPEERSHIFHIDDRFIVTDQHRDVCATIKNSLGGAHPFSNYLLRGAPGGGKSTFVQIVAAGLGLPYYSDVLRDDITADFFSGYYAPDCDKVGKHIGIDEFLAQMPSAEDMAFDPLSAYMQITGKENESATANDCMLALMQRVQEVCSKAEGESKQTLTFVEGLVPKLVRPCLVFYDEVTVPKNPGVIAALNTLMDNQRKFTLTSGRVIERHPKTVMMFAGNFDDVEGCREPNRAWQDRNNEIIDVDPPTAEQMKAMLIASTGYDPNVNGNINIDAFISIWPQLQEISAEYYGVCGPRALSDWLAKSMALGDPRRAAETTILTKSSSDKMCQAEMREKIDLVFA